MKLHPDGTKEMTVAEYIEYQRLQAEKAERKPFKNPYASVDTDWMRGQTIITSGDPPGSIGSGSTAVKRCDHPCHCTGACEGRTSADRQRKWASDYNNEASGRFKELKCTNL